MLIKILVFLILRVNIKLSNTLKILASLILLLVQHFSWTTCSATRWQDYNRVKWHYLYLPLVFCNRCAVENIAEFAALALERRNSFIGKRIDIASDEITGEQAAKVLSNELGHKITYEQVPMEQIRQASEDLAVMFEWFERIGTGVDVAALHKQYPEVNWLTFKDWVKSQNWGDLAEHSIK